MVTHILVALLTTGTPIDGLIIRDGGTRIGPSGWKALELNCGQNMTCTQSGNVATISSQATLADGGAITSGAPIDAQYWTGASNATLTAEKNLGALGTGLVINTAGVPSAYAGAACSASNYATATSASGALTCSIPPGTCSGGSSPQLQYNGSGSCGGVAKVERSSDGNLSVISTYTHPSAPTGERSEHYDFAPDAGWTHFLKCLDPATGAPMPCDLTAGDWLMPQPGARDLWSKNCWWGDIGGGNCSWNQGGAGFGMQGTSSGGNAATSMDAGWWSHQNWCRRIGLTTGNSNMEDHTTNLSMHHSGGNGYGGFQVWMRASMLKANPAPSGRAFYGVASTTNAFAITQEMSNLTNAIGFLCDPLDTSWRVCTTGNLGQTCSSALGADFPCKDAATYDFWLYNPPNQSIVLYYIYRLPSTDNAAQGKSASGVLTGVQFPWPEQGLGIHMHRNSGDGGLAEQVAHAGACEWNHY